MHYVRCITHISYAMLRLNVRAMRCSGLRMQLFYWFWSIAEIARNWSPCSVFKISVWSFTYFCHCQQKHHVIPSGFESHPFGNSSAQSKLNAEIWKSKIVRWMSAKCEPLSNGKVWLLQLRLEQEFIAVVWTWKLVSDTVWLFRVEFESVHQLLKREASWALFEVKCREKLFYSFFDRFLCFVKYCGLVRK